MPRRRWASCERRWRAYADSFRCSARAARASSTLTAPIDGVVVDLHATLGETATPDQAVFIVTDPTKVWVRGNVPELELARVRGTAPRSSACTPFPTSRCRARSPTSRPRSTNARARCPSGSRSRRPTRAAQRALRQHRAARRQPADERVLVVPVDAIATIDGTDGRLRGGDEPNSFEPQPVALGRRAGGLYRGALGPRARGPRRVSGAFTLKSALESGELSEGHAH
jgi:cobalt-zinc-cadmium efflux system membrane fusion protein